jgi:hypothetical protein
VFLPDSPFVFFALRVGCDCYVGFVLCMYSYSGLVSLVCAITSAAKVTIIIYRRSTGGIKWNCCITGSWDIYYTLVDGDIKHIPYYYILVELSTLTDLMTRIVR